MTDEPRRPIARRLRFEILRRDNYTCRYCGDSAPDVKLTVDHVIPIALGGGDEPNNLVTACQPCNEGKASTSPDEHTVEDVDATAMLFARAVDKVAEQRRAEQSVLDGVLDNVEEHWSTWTVGDAKRPIERPSDWRATIERLLDRGLDEVEIHRYIDVAMESRVPAYQTWRYFCGCCWKELTRRSEMARRLIEDGEV